MAIVVVAKVMTDRSSRQSFLGNDSDAILTSLHVGIVGLGGGGSHVAQQLAHVGVGEFTIIDDDSIDLSNLNRLVGGTAADVKSKRLKTRIATRQIRRVHPSAVVRAITAKWQFHARALLNCHVIVGCLDSFAGRLELEALARRYLIPYVDLGMDVFDDGGRFAITGQVMLSMPGEPCLRCTNVIKDSQVGVEAANYGAAGGRPQVVWPNGILASTAVGLIVELATPWYEHRPGSTLLEYDGNSGTIASSTSLPHLSGCPHYEGISSLGDPFFELWRWL
ncbi:MAG: thiamine/molybdopterin biosynthesis protein [Bryobacterales bacterium]|nr:thiamine/molybdopterin biosynthesis protein [Bryobacterales bacterium]